MIEEVYYLKVGRIPLFAEEVVINNGVVNPFVHE